MGREGRASRRTERVSARSGDPALGAQATYDMTPFDDLAYIEDDTNGLGAANSPNSKQGFQPIVRASKRSSRGSEALPVMTQFKEKEAVLGMKKSNSSNAPVVASHRETRQRVLQNDGNIEEGFSNEGDDDDGNDDDDDDHDEEEYPGAISVGRSRVLGDVEHGNPDALKKDEYYTDDVEGTLPEANVVTRAEIPIDEDEEFLQKAQKDAEAAFLSKVATAEVFDEDEEKKHRLVKRRRIVFCAIAISLIVIGVVVGVVLVLTGTSNTDDGGQPQNAVDPTTFDNITATASSCGGALTVSSIPAIITGSTAAAVTDESFDVCGSISVNGAGVWYALQGKGRPLSLSTCFGSSYDTQISIYEGDDCSSLKCVEGNDQRTNCGRDGSHLTFLAEQGTSYFIFVHGLRRANGVFTLSIEEVVINSQCTSATRINDTDPNGEVTFFGSTKYSSVDDSLEDCLTPITSPGVWYIFQPVSTRFVQARVDDFSSEVSVFLGPCDSLQCLAASQVGTAMWTATAGIEYLIFVHGEGKQTADFSLTILAGGLLRPSGNVTNNECILALQLFVPTSDNPILTQASTALGVVADVPGCGSLSESSAKGMWYYVVGNGSGMQASTCDTDTGFVAQVTVYQGDCLNLTCINGGDQNCGDQSAVAWYGEVGVPYYILVQGIDESREGDFTLKLEAVLPEVSKDCNVPVPVVLNGVTILGSSLDGTLENAGSCENINFTAPSVWYAVEGTGSPIVASTCDSYSESYAKIEVYTGTCASRSCTADVKKVSCGDQMVVVWDSSPGETYLIQVYGSGSGIANKERFTLTVEEIPDNYVCPGASTELGLRNSVQGSTLFPTPNTTSGCAQADGVGFWYKIQGTHTGKVTISTCSRLTNFHPKLTVFQGNSCDQLVCISTNNDEACGAGSFVTWEALSSEVYYVLLQGGGPDEFGNFELTIGPENDICDSAGEPLSVNGSVVLGSTLQATAEAANDLGCFDTGTAAGGPGVWYTVFGVGALLKASTCSNQTTFDTQISVYEGSSCSELSCVAANDNFASCGDQSSVTWFAEQNQLYYLLIHGFEIGDFALMVSEVDNDSCIDSQSVLLTGEKEEVVGINAFGESYVDPCTGRFISGQLGSWWSISGTGGTVSINACGSDGSNLPTLISVYNQNCADLSCQTFVENTCLVDFETTFLQEYAIIVSNNLTDVGSSYEMEIVASNDECGTAFGPLSAGDLVRGSTIGATEDDVALCGGVTSRGAGVWYSFTGTGDTVTVFTCSEFTDFSTQLTLFKGDGCGSLTCVASKEGNCGKDAWLQYEFEESSVYFVLVSGKPGFPGNFVLQVA